jgi:hypothetical protein
MTILASATGRRPDMIGICAKRPLQIGTQPVGANLS